MRANGVCKRAHGVCACAAVRAQHCVHRRPARPRGLDCKARCARVQWRGHAVCNTGRRQAQAQRPGAVWSEGPRLMVQGLVGSMVGRGGSSGGYTAAVSGDDDGAGSVGQTVGSVGVAEEIDRPGGGAHLGRCPRSEVKAGSGCDGARGRPRRGTRPEGTHARIFNFESK